MNKSTNLQPGSVSSSDLIDAKLEEHQLCGSKQCPYCGHKLEGKPDWVGLPAGVKFDPTDQELIEHLEAKVEGKESKSHPLIDEFIPTIEGEDGICYTHPERLPGVTRDGLSRHFFHRPSKAYTTGTRKRRKIQTESDLPQTSGSSGSGGGGETRWHKTGKTRPVMVNGKQKGCKKILVLYTNFGKNRKPEKTNWVMHQYHLGQHEEEKEGELVVSKIFYQTQPRQCNWSDKSGVVISTAASAGVEGNIRETPGGSGGGGSCSSSREILFSGDDFSGTAAAAVAVNISTVGAAAPTIPSYGATIDHFQQLKADHFGFLPFRKPFDEQQQAGSGNIIGEASITREVGACEERDMGQQHHMTHEAHRLHHHQHQQQLAAAYHISRPSHSISTIISAPLPLHQTSINFLEQDQLAAAYHVPRTILPANNFQQEEQQQHDHKLGGSCASGLEELIMGCTSTDIKEESAMGNTQEPEWLKYSSFWPDPDNQDHHG